MQELMRLPWWTLVLLALQCAGIIAGAVFVYVIGADVIRRWRP